MYRAQHGNAVLTPAEQKAVTVALAKLQIRDQLDINDQALVAKLVAIEAGQAQLDNLAAQVADVQKQLKQVKSWSKQGVIRRHAQSTDPGLRAAAQARIDRES